MAAHQPLTHNLALPAEILHAIKRELPGTKRKNTICAGRLVCRAWNKALSAVLFRNPRFFLGNSKGPRRDQVHNLEALAQMLESGPYVCSLVESLTIVGNWWMDSEPRVATTVGGDDGPGGEVAPGSSGGLPEVTDQENDFNALVGVHDYDEESIYSADEWNEYLAEQNAVVESDDSSSDEGNDNIDEDYDGYDEGDRESDEEVTVYQESESFDPSGIRCSIDPAHLRRVLLCFPNLREIKLRNVLLTGPLHRDALPKALLAPLRVSTMRIEYPGWHCIQEHQDQVAYLLKCTLSAFDAVDAVSLTLTAWNEFYYTNIAENILAEPEPVIPYQVRSFTTIQSQGVFFRTLALNSGFSGLEHIRWHGMQADDANPVFRASGGTLSVLRLCIPAPRLVDEKGTRVHTAFPTTATHVAFA